MFPTSDSGTRGGITQNFMRYFFSYASRISGPITNRRLDFVKSSSINSSEIPSSQTFLSSMMYVHRGALDWSLTARLTRGSAGRYGMVRIRRTWVPLRYQRTHEYTSARDARESGRQ